MIQRPLPGEYNAYFQRYIDTLPDASLPDLMDADTSMAIEFFSHISPEKQDYCYESDKWSIKQILMHIIDVERVMAYRALVAARGDTTTLLYSMDDHAYLANANVEGRLYADMIDEFKAVRGATTSLFASMTDAQSERMANTNNGIVSTRALAYIILGHVRHHIGIIRERYV